MHSKNVLRKSMIAKLYSLSQGEKKRIENELYTNLFASELWKKANVIGITIANEYEWDTHPIIKQAWEERKCIAIPKCIPTNHMLKFYRYTDKCKLERGFFNLLEPNPENTVEIAAEDMDLLIVPGIVFDKGNYRIGHGGGYYDRYLKEYTGKSLSLAGRDQILPSIPKEEFDQPVDLIISNT